eukprot:6176677-Pyramimonas_sp.AAC.2
MSSSDSEEARRCAMYTIWCVSHAYGTDTLFIPKILNDAPPDTTGLPPPERTIEVRTEHTYSGEQAVNLFNMTPFFWNASEELQARVNRGEVDFATPINFVISTYRL